MIRQDKGSYEVERKAPCRKGSIVARDLDGEAILYNPETRQVHILNKAALLVWQLCDGQHSIGDMVAAIADLYSLSVEEREREAISIEQDIQGIIHDFEIQGMIEK